jgi:hypothetical protein
MCALYEVLSSALLVVLLRRLLLPGKGYARGYIGDFNESTSVNLLYR